MNAEAQKRALAASRKAASLVFTDVGDDEDSSVAAEAAPARGDVRRVEYSAEMAGLAFLLEVEIKGTLPRSSNIDLTNSGCPEASQTLGYLHQSAVKANLETDMEIDKEMMQRDGMHSLRGKGRLEQLSPIMELVNTQGK